MTKLAFSPLFQCISHAPVQLPLRTVVACLLLMFSLFVPSQVYAQPVSEPDEPMADAPNLDAELIMNFEGAALSTVLDYLCEEAGLIVVSDAEIDGRVTIMSRQPMSLDEALNMLNTVLFQEGYTAIRRERLLKIVSLEDAKTQSIPVHYGSDPEQIGNSDTIITQIIPIKYAEASGIAQDISPLVDSEFAELAANDSSNSLIVTDTEANVRRIAQIVQALDQSISSVTEVRVFPLQFADAADTARLIENTFESPISEEEALGRAIQNRFQGGGRGGPGGGGGRGGDDSGGGGAQGRAVTASADDRTNSIVVSASPEVMVAIEVVIAELDADTTAKESVLIYHVRNMQAVDLEDVFNTLFADSSGTTSGDNQSRAGADGGGRGAQVQAANAVAATGNSGAADLVGQVTAVANEDTNTLLVLTQEKNFDRIQDILDELDRPIPQVLIRVLISEVTYDDTLDIGVEFEGINLGTTTDDNILTNFNLFESTLGLNYLLFSNDNFRAAIRALEATGKFDVLSRPYLLTSDNHEASITVGEEVPFVTNSRQSDDGDTINTIEYRDVGIILTVTPQINSEGLVVLDLTQELSALTERAIPISEDLEAVIINQRTLTTQVAVADGQTVVIGGLMEDELQETITKVPLLGDIPFVGELFRRTERNTVKTELLIFLTPEVIEDPSELSAMSQRIQEDAEGLKDAIEPGLLQEHLDQMDFSPDDDEVPADDAGEDDTDTQEVSP